MNAIELQTLAAEARLAQLDLDAVHLAARVGQATDDEVGQAVGERDCALDLYEEAEALADEAPAPRPRGYVFCACRDCFDVTIGGWVCHHCEEAGCSDDGDQECYRDDACEG